LLDTPPEPSFDRLTRLAAKALGVPIALISLVDEKREWFKSHFGLPLREISRNDSFCAHAIVADDMLVVGDATQDQRFCDSPLVVGDPHVWFNHVIEHVVLVKRHRQRSTEGGVCHRPSLLDQLSSSAFIYDHGQT
jgi:GAF domain-containing protein